MNKKWEYCNIDTKEVEKIKNQYNVSDLVATVIANKKLTAFMQRYTVFGQNKTQNQFN